MSNIWGKTLLEAKRVGSAISKSAKEVGGAIGQATANVADHTKKTAKIAMLKAEMDQMSTKLGKAVFNYGITEENEEALEIMKEMLNKKSEIEKLEKELDNCDCKCEHNHECGHEGPCDCECDCIDCDEEVEIDEEKCDCENCGDDCDCECHDEKSEFATNEENDAQILEQTETTCICDDNTKTEE